jgi:hypothetical protein
LDYWGLGWRRRHFGLNHVGGHATGARRTGQGGRHAFIGTVEADRARGPARGTGARTKKSFSTGLRVAAGPIGTHAPRRTLLWGGQARCRTEEARRALTDIHRSCGPMQPATRERITPTVRKRCIPYNRATRKKSRYLQRKRRPENTSRLLTGRLWGRPCRQDKSRGCPFRCEGKCDPVVASKMIEA